MSTDFSMQCLVYYAAVAKGNVIIADYADGAGGSTDLPSMVVSCLELVPPLHSRFSYTTCHHTFICLMDAPFIYCAIVDEALNKSKAYMFLEHVRDAFKLLLQQGGTPVESLVHYSLQKDMAALFKHLAVPLVGTPQKEKDQMEEEGQLQAQKYQDIDFEVCSPSAIAPLQENHGEFDKTTEQKPLGSWSPRMSWIAAGRRERKRSREQVKQEKDIILETSVADFGKEKKLGVMTDHQASLDLESQGQINRCICKLEQSAQRTWWRNVQIVIMLDVFICLILLAIWLGVCSGVTCLKRNT